MRGLNKHFRHNCARLFAAVLVTIMVFNCLPFAAPDGAVAYAMELSGSYSLNGTDYSGTLSDAFDALTAEGTNTLVLKSDFLVDKRLILPREYKLVINLDGHTISGDITKRNGFITVLDNASLRILGNGGKLSNFAETEGNGGVIFAGDYSNIELEKLTISGNNAKNGGAIYLENQTVLRMAGVELTGNTSSENGGAIYINGSLSCVEMDNAVKIVRNIAANSGGAIYIDGNNVEISGSGATISGNYTIGGNGSGIYAAGDVEIGKSSGISIRDLKLNDNKSMNCGGGICLKTGGCTLNNITLTGNSASDKGGGICDLGYGVKNEAGNRFINITATENTVSSATGQGGGIYVAPDRTLNITGKIIVSGNKVSKNADNIYLDDSDKGSHAYLSIANLATDSEVGIVRKDSSYNLITNDPCDAKLRLFTYDNSGYHLDTDEDPQSVTYKYLMVKSGAPDSGATAVALDITKWKTGTADAGFTYLSTDGAEYPVIYGYASSPDNNVSKDIVNKYFWSEGYFMSDPSVYDVHLSTMSMNMAMAGGDSNLFEHSDYRYKFDNIKSLLKGIGCTADDIYINDWYIQKPTDDSIGVAIGKRKITSLAEGNAEYTLIPIVVRSSNYESEWASNMTMNGANTEGEENAESSGFRSARTHVIESLEYYLDHYNVRPLLKEGKVKFWVTGYSRGAATANLVAKYLVDNYGNYSLQYVDNPNQVFAYCMAAPQGGTDSAESVLAKDDDSKGYYCIHNVLNKADQIPLMAPGLMGFKRYGVDHYVPGSEKGEVTATVNKASDENGSYAVTTYKDNEPWKTKTTEYNMWRPNMIDQLAVVNSGVKFNDNFKVTDFSVLPPNLKPTQDPALSNVCLEDWSENLYTDLQSWEVLGEGKKLTRANYSGYTMREGTPEGSWYNNGTTVQNALRELIILMKSKSSQENEKLMNAIKSVYNKLGTSGNIFSSKPSVLTIYTKLISNYGWKDPANQQYWLDQFWSMLIDNSDGQPSILDPGVLTQTELASFKQYYPVILGLCFRVMPIDYKNNDFHYVATFANNASVITQTHVPEINLAWLRSFDSFYDAEKDKSYRFAGGEAAPAVPSPANLTDGSSYNGARILKLTGDADSEIYYMLTKTVGSENIQSPLMLYRSGEGIDLFPSKDGDVLYTVETYALRNYVDVDGKVGIYSSASKAYSFYISDGRTLFVKNKPEMTDYDSISYAGGSQVSLDAKLTKDQESSYRFKEWKIEIKDGDTWSDWDGITTNARKKAVCTFSMPDSELRAEAVFAPVVTLKGLTDIGINLSTFSAVAGEKLLSKTESAPVFTDGNSEVAYSGTVRLRWESNDSVVTDMIKPEMQYRFIYELEDWISADGATAYRFDKAAENWTVPEDAGYAIETTEKGIKVVSKWFAAVGDQQPLEQSSFTLKIDFHSLADEISPASKSFTVEKGSEFTLDAASLLYEAVSGAADDENASTYDFVYMTQTGIPEEDSKLFEDYFWFDMPENDVNIDIYFGKAIEEIHLQTEYAPEPNTGNLLEAGISSCTITIGNIDYYLSSDDIKESWTPDSVTARGNTVYTVTYTIDMSKLKDSEGKDISGSYIIYDDSMAFINESDADEMKHYSSHIIPGENEGEADENGLYNRLSFSHIFEVTENPTVTGIYNPEDVTIVWDSAVTDREFADLIAPQLPATVNAITDDSSLDCLSVSWNQINTGYDPSSLAAQNITVSGTVTIPEGYRLSEDEETAVTVKVSLEGAPYTSMAIPYPDSEVIECDMPSGEGSIEVELSCESQDAKVYYTLDGSSPVDAKGRISENAISYTEGDKILISGNALVDGKQIVSLKTTAIKDGMQAAEVYTSGYEFIKPMADVSQDDLEMIYMFELEKGHKLDSIAAGLLPEGWSWDAEINDPSKYPADNAVQIGDFVDAVISYNPDSNVYSDTKLVLSIPVVAEQYLIESEISNAMAYKLLGSEDIPEGEEDEYVKYDDTHYLSKRILSAESGTEIVLIYDKKDEFGNNLEYIRINTASGKEIVPSAQNVDFSEEMYSCIFTMPAENVQIVPVYAGPEEADVSAVLLNGNMSAKELTLVTGMKTALYPSVYPFNTLDKISSVSWKVDKAGKGVISLKKGLITAKKAGEATVTARVKILKNGSATVTTQDITCKIHVTAAEAKPANKQADKRYKLTLAKNTIKMDVKAQENATITAKLSSPKKPLKQEDLEKAIIEAGSTNERVVRIGEYDGVWAKNLTGTQLTSDIPIIVVEPGTAYVYVKTKLEDSSSYNIRVCKVTVTAKASEVEITGDSANKMTGYTEDELKKMNISVKSTDPVDKNNIGLIELKQGECDRLFTSLTPANTTDIVNMKWTVSGGVTIKNGVVYAKKASAVKKGITTPAKVTLTCGKKKYMIYIVVK